MNLVELGKLSGRELQVVRCICEGMYHKEIAARLDIAVKTVEVHREHIGKKLGFRHPALLTRWAIRNELLDA